MIFGIWDRDRVKARVRERDREKERVTAMRAIGAVQAERMVRVASAPE